MVSARAREPIRRGALLDRLRDAQVAIIDGPGGFGKTTLAEQCAQEWALDTIRLRFAEPTDLRTAAAALARATLRAGLVDLHAAIRDVADHDVALAVDTFVAGIATRTTPCTIVLDDVHRLDADATREFASALEDCVGVARVVVAGRTTQGFEAIGTRVHSVHVGVDALRMDDGEVIQLLRAAIGAEPDATLAAEIAEATLGWPAAIGLACRRLEHDPTWTPAASPQGSAVLRELVSAAIHDDPALAALAALPLVDATSAEAVAGPDALARAHAAGLLGAREGAWWVVPDPIAEVLGEHAQLSTGVARTVASHYHERGDTRAACALLARRDPEGLGALLAAAHWTELESLGGNEVATLVECLETSMKSGALVPPRAWLAAARAVEATTPDRRGPWLACARDLAGTDAALLREIDAERARDAIADGAVDDAAALATAVLDAASDEETVARGRALATLARATVLPCTVDAFVRGSELYADAATCFTRAGETRWLADARARRAYTTLFYAGHIEAGAEELREALALLPRGDHTRGFWLTNHADVLDVLGHATEATAAANEALAIGTRRRDHALVGMALWSLSWIAAHRGDLDGLVRAAAQFEEHAGPWVRAGQMVEFLASTADLLVLLGDVDGYERYVTRARAAAETIDYVNPVRVVEARFEAMYGDPELALGQLDEFEAGIGAVATSRPTRLAVRAVAHARLGDLAAADLVLAEADAIAASMGVPDLVARHARPLVAMVHELRLAAGAAPAGPTLGEAPPGAAQRIEVRGFGGFTVEQAGADVTPPPGHPATLVKLLALRDSMTTEAAIDTLWPDTDLATGRARLRNLLNRIRQRAGDLVVRDGELLRLAPHVAVDVTTFEERAAEALSGDPASRVGHARAAIALYAGPLLPGDVYEEWTASPRERTKRRYLALLDLVADDAAEHGDTEEAARLLDLGIDAEPLDESRYARLCEVLVARGRTGSAREVAQRAIVALEEIGLTVDDRLLELAASG